MTLALGSIFSIVERRNLMTLVVTLVLKAKGKSKDASILCRVGMTNKVDDRFRRVLRFSARSGLFIPISLHPLDLPLNTSHALIS